MQLKTTFNYLLIILQCSNLTPCLGNYPVSEKEGGKWGDGGEEGQRENEMREKEGWIEEEEEQNEGKNYPFLLLIYTKCQNNYLNKPCSH